MSLADFRDLSLWALIIVLLATFASLASQPQPKTCIDRVSSYQKGDRL